MSLVALICCHSGADSILQSQQWTGECQIEGAYLVSSVELNYLNTICVQINTNILTFNDTIHALILSRPFTSTTPDVSYIRRASFVLLSAERAITEIIEIIERDIVCSPDMLHQITTTYYSLKTTLNVMWDKLRKSTGARPTQEVTMAFISARPKLNRPPPGAQILIGTLVGSLAAGFLGGIIGSTFGADHSQQINDLNDNIGKVNKKVLITNKRIDLLSEEVQNALKDIKLILSHMQAYDQESELKTILLWNIEQIKLALTNQLIVLKISQNTVSLLRAGIINTDVVDIKSIRAVIKEGTTFYKDQDLTFPIKNISKEKIATVLSLIEIRPIGANKFIAIIPLVYKMKYKIYSLIPHPVKIEKTLMIAEVKEVLLHNNQSYITTSLQNIHSINNSSHVLRQIEPIWDAKQSSCEWEGIKKNVSAMLKLCNFRRLGTTNGIYLANTANDRLIYLTQETVVELSCPEGKIRDKLIGLNHIPQGCDLKTDLVNWPARQSKQIAMSSISQKPTNNTFDVTHLPTIKLNDTNRVHTSIKTLVDKLNPDKPLTFKFTDIPLEEVQLYTIAGTGIVSIIVMINSVLIVYLCYKGRLLKRDEEPEVELGLRKSMQKKILFSPRDSLKFSPRDSFRRIQNKLKNTRDNISLSELTSRNSSLREKLRKPGRSVRRKLQHQLNNNPDNSDSSSVSQYSRPHKKHSKSLYPHLSSDGLTQRVKIKGRKPAIPAF